jgi:transposase InsO family protein
VSADLAQLYRHRHCADRSQKTLARRADESFNGKFRDECLSLQCFRRRHEACVVIETWCRHYNRIRPHSSLKDLTPVEFKTRSDSINPGAILK